jgi:ABC-type xylose transport system permease subunit
VIPIPNRMKPIGVSRVLNFLVPYRQFQAFKGIVFFEWRDERRQVRRQLLLLRILRTFIVLVLISSVIISFFVKGIEIRTVTLGLLTIILVLLILQIYYLIRLRRNVRRWRRW